MNFKIWRQIAPFIKKWSLKIARSLGFGVVIFAIFGWRNWEAGSFQLFKDQGLSLFFGLFAIYMWLGVEIINTSKNEDFDCNFSTVNLIIGFGMLLLSAVGFIFFPSILLITWPLTVAGAILFIAAIFGLFGAVVSTPSSYDLE